MAEYNMPQYVLREFKVTDARVSQIPCSCYRSATKGWLSTSIADGKPIFISQITLSEGRYSEVYHHILLLAEFVEIMLKNSAKPNISQMLVPSTEYVKILAEFDMVSLYFFSNPAKDFSLTFANTDSGCSLLVAGTLNDDDND